MQAKLSITERLDLTPEKTFNTDKLVHYSKDKENEMIERGEPKPFHESIIDALGETSGDDVNPLLRLIARTKIPLGHHEKIATAVESIHGDNPLSVSVLKSIREQADALKAKSPLTAQHTAGRGGALGAPPLDQTLTSQIAG